MRKFPAVVLLGALLFVSMSSVATMQAPPAPPKPPAVPAPPPPPPPPPPPGAAKASAAYKVDVVIQRTKGAMILSNLPNSLSIGAAMNEAGSAALRIGSQVPIPTELPAGGFNYQSVGTNIDCNLTPRPDGRYDVRLNIEDTSVANQDGPTRTPPVLRSYRITTTLVARDAQTSQVNLATDKGSGETVTAHVTVTALKP